MLKIKHLGSSEGPIKEGKKSPIIPKERDKSLEVMTKKLTEAGAGCEHFVEGMEVLVQGEIPEASLAPLHLLPCSTALAWPRSAPSPDTTSSGSWHLLGSLPLCTF